MIAVREHDQASCLWLLDVRQLWDGKKIDDAAPKALRALGPDEQAKARAFYFLRDAKLSVGSSLLKRLFINKYLQEPWHSIKFTRMGNPKHGKPCYLPAGASTPPADFNVTHQAGLVALAGTTVPGVQFGIDVVCVNERNERKHVEEEGFKSWIDMHRDVFSDADIRNMQYPKQFNSDTMSIPEEGVDAKLRRFFAYWALKEAYVKLEGEALLADWLRDVEFRNVRVPRPVSESGAPRVDDIEVWIKGVRREDVKLTLQSFEEEYMIAVAVKKATGSTTFLPHPTLKALDLDNNVLCYAQAS